MYLQSSGVWVVSGVSSSFSGIPHHQWQFPRVSGKGYDQFRIPSYRVPGAGAALMEATDWMCPDRGAVWMAPRVWAV